MSQQSAIITSQANPKAKYNTIIYTEEGGSSIDIIDNLNSTRADAALSAKQGKVLNESKAAALTTEALTYTSGSTYTLNANKIYTLNASSAASGGSFTLTLAANPAVTDIFDIQITTGSNAPTITFPTGISWAGGSAPTIAASKKYEINICNNLAAYVEF